MAKLYYSKERQRYEVSQVNQKGGRTLIDYDTDFDALGIRQGFISDDELDDENFDPCVVVESDEQL